MKYSSVRNWSFTCLLLIFFVSQFCACSGDNAAIPLLSPTITSTDHKVITEGLAGTFTFTATGIPTPAFTLTGALPSGVTFDEQTGILSGIPDTGTNGTYPLVVTASNGVPPDATQNFTLTITAPVAIGDDFGGGIVAYILQEGDPGFDESAQNGLIAASADQSTSIVWHVTNDGDTGATGTALGTGQANTTAILALYGAEANAAKLCADYNVSVYDDWYLPSLTELNTLYALKVLGFGGFANSYYWTSSECNAGGAWAQSFSDGSQIYGQSKNSLNIRVRPVRSF